MSPGGSCADGGGFEAAQIEGWMVRVDEKSLTGDSRCGQAFAPPTAPPSDYEYYGA
ncbi:MAG: hypothetical protein QE273_10655 [Verrucomicrobiales bacterium]|nr:hypothetical protein [Verrucomicrobiales bacterium]